MRYKRIAIVSGDSNFAWTVFSGFSGSAAATLVAYPLDVIKTQIQSDPGKRHKLMRSVFAELSYHRLYQGAGSTLVGLGFARGLKFVVFDALTAYGGGASLQRNPSLVSLLNGSIAGAVQGVFLTPIELIKTRMQLQFPASGLTETCYQIYRTEGAAGFYKGAPSVIALKSTWNGIYFLTINAVQSHGVPACVSPKESRVTFFAGILGGVFASVVTIPIDVVRVRIQGNRDGLLFREVARAIFKQEGILGFYKGTFPKILYFGVSGGLSNFFVREIQGLKDFERATKVG
ncbi:hypothetical protein EBR96_01705 [bacterium]|nr:hypothetical protein [bacterium]